MPLPQNIRNIKSKVYWPIRASFSCFSHSIACLKFPSLNIVYGFEFDTALNYRGFAFPSIQWTRLNISFPVCHEGDDTLFNEWCRTENGKRKLIDDILTYQNLLIDNLKHKFEYKYNIINLKHFGPAEWPYVACQYNDTILFEILNPSFKDLFSDSLPQPSLLGWVNDGPVSSTIKFLQRSVDLSESGYPTEGLLIAISLLDSVLQDVIVSGMARLNISKENAESQLGNITKSRFATYLDMVYKLVFGYSLKEENGALYSELISVNKLRNEAIHNGIEISRSTSKKAIITIYNILEFISRTSKSNIVLPPKPTFLEY